MNSVIDGLIVLNLNGSKEEKISGIIQNMGDPIITLKVISLFNLMFYSLRRLSQVDEVSGLRI